MVSIIIYLTKKDSNIKKCVNSILLQTYQDFEVIIIYDNQSDISHSIYNLTDEDNRIQIFNPISQKGPANGRNSGMFYASGNYFLFLNSEDVLEPRALEYLTNKAKKYNADLVMGNIKYNNTKELKKSVFDGLMINQVFSPSNLKNCIHYPYILDNKLWNADIILHNQIKFKNIFLGEDILFYNLALAHCRKVVTTSEYVVIKNIDCEIEINNLADCYDNPFDILKSNYERFGRQNFASELIFAELLYCIDGINSLYLYKDKKLRKVIYKLLSNDKNLLSLSFNDIHNDKYMQESLLKYKKLRHKSFIYAHPMISKIRIKLLKKLKKMFNFLTKIKNKFAKKNKKNTKNINKKANKNVVLNAKKDNINLSEISDLYEFEMIKNKSSYNSSEDFDSLSSIATNGGIDSMHTFNNFKTDEKHDVNNELSSINNLS